ncbi:hypothetical protein GGR54DRAFT_647735 [Hypoxylon sp. NC1633]|nr:hypothetical protein GGR54DRAFT_647735 [Hypoxylon sp. NC1633]
MPDSFFILSQAVTAAYRGDLQEAFSNNALIILGRPDNQLEVVDDRSNESVLRWLEWVCNKDSKRSDGKVQFSNMVLRVTKSKRNGVFAVLIGQNLDDRAKYVDNILSDYTVCLNFHRKMEFSHYPILDIKPTAKNQAIIRRACSPIIARKDILYYRCRSRLPFYGFPERTLPDYEDEEFREKVSEARQEGQIMDVDLVTKNTCYRVDSMMIIARRTKDGSVELREASTNAVVNTTTPVDIILWDCESTLYALHKLDTFITEQIEAEQEATAKFAEEVDSLTALFSATSLGPDDEDDTSKKATRLNKSAPLDDDAALKKSGTRGQKLSRSNKGDLRELRARGQKHSRDENALDENEPLLYGPYEEDDIYEEGPRRHKRIRKDNSIVQSIGQRNNLGLPLKRAPSPPPREEDLDDPSFEHRVRTQRPDDYGPSYPIFQGSLQAFT